MKVLEYARRCKGLTLRELGALAKVNPADISKEEGARPHLYAAQLARIADILDVEDPSYLLEEVEEVPPND